MVGFGVTGWLGEDWAGEAWGRTGGAAAAWTDEVAGGTGDAAAAGGEMPDGQTGTIAGAVPAGEAAPAASPLHEWCRREHDRYMGQKCTC